MNIDEGILRTMEQYPDVEAVAGYMATLFFTRLLRDTPVIERLEEPKLALEEEPRHAGY